MKKVLAICLAISILLNILQVVLSLQQKKSTVFMEGQFTLSISQSCQHLDQYLMNPQKDFEFVYATNELNTAWNMLLSLSNDKTVKHVFNNLYNFMVLYPSDMKERSKDLIPPLRLLLSDPISPEAYKTIGSILQEVADLHPDDKNQLDI